MQTGAAAGGRGLPPAWGSYGFACPPSTPLANRTPSQPAPGPRRLPRSAPRAWTSASRPTPASRTASRSRATCRRRRRPRPPRTRSTTAPRSLRSTSSAAPWPPRAARASAPPLPPLRAWAPAPPRPLSRRRAPRRGLRWPPIRRRRRRRPRRLPPRPRRGLEGWRSCLGHATLSCTTTCWHAHASDAGPEPKRPQNRSTVRAQTPTPSAGAPSRAPGLHPSHPSTHPCRRTPGRQRLSLRSQPGTWRCQGRPSALPGIPHCQAYRTASEAFLG
jgi:hypothetical protein